jgi:hypothetical protein
MADEKLELEESPLSPQVPVHYFNGFTIGFGNSDFTLTLKLDSRDIFHFKASYTVMKTLSEKLDTSFKQFEKLVGQSMLTTEKVGSAIEKARKEQSQKQK